MEPSKQIDEWRAEGYKVNITHLRRVQQRTFDTQWHNQRGYMRKREIALLGGEYLRINPLGGVVELKLSGGPLAEGVVVMAVEVCSDSDCFNKHTGLVKVVGQMMGALGRLPE